MNRRKFLGSSLVGASSLLGVPLVNATEKQDSSLENFNLFPFCQDILLVFDRKITNCSPDIKKIYADYLSLTEVYCKTAFLEVVDIVTKTDNLLTSKLVHLKTINNHLSRLLFNSGKENSYLGEGDFNQCIDKIVKWIRTGKFWHETCCTGSVELVRQTQYFHIIHCQNQLENNQSYLICINNCLYNLSRVKWMYTNPLVIYHQDGEFFKENGTEVSSKLAMCILDNPDGNLISVVKLIK